MKFIPGFEEATYHYLDSPTSIYYIWHRYKKQDGSQGNRIGAVTNHYYLMEILQRESFDIYDEHISVFAFRKTKDAKNSVTGKTVDTSSVVVNKIFFDMDPPKDIDMLSWQSWKFRDLRSNLQFNVPCRLYATGRGYLAIIDLEEEISIKEAYDIQKRMDVKYKLQSDVKVPITVLRVFKIPYTKNAKTDTWVLPIMPRNTYQDVFRMQRYENITSRALWLDREPISLARLRQIAS